MAGPVPVIYVLVAAKKDVDACDERWHDDESRTLSKARDSCPFA
jgi:hypothetical protein